MAERDDEEVAVAHGVAVEPGIATIVVQNDLVLGG